MDTNRGQFEIIVGTYEEYLLGYKMMKTDKEYKLNQTIASHSHKASLRAVTSHNKYLASGGADECIHLYDTDLRKECGLLMHHSGTVTCLRFTPDGHYLMSGSEDGSIAMFAIGSWVLDKEWPKAHKGKAVNHLSIHPTGKLALSVGADCTLKTWNLVKGRCAYIVNIASKCKRPEIIEWALNGQYFGLVSERELNIYSVASASVIKTILIKNKIISLQFLMDNCVCLGDSIGDLTCFDFFTGEKMWDIPANVQTRIKCISLYENWLISATSNGTIRVYDISEGKTPKLTTFVETSCRITCMTISQIPSDSKENIKIKKRKAKFCSEENNLKNIKLFPTNDKNVHCYPPNQKWTIESNNK